LPGLRNIPVEPCAIALLTNGTSRLMHSHRLTKRVNSLASKNYDLAHIYAGEAVELVTRQQSAEEVIRYLDEGAERLVRDRSSRLLEGQEAAREGQ
jgi:hypothetical protein